MLIPTKGVVINNVNFGPYITQAHFGYHKLWGKGSGRNMNQSVTGSFNLFPKVTLKFRTLTQSELEVISRIVNAQTQSVTYYDPDLGRQNTFSTYSDDLEYDQEKLGKVKGTKIAFISRNRRVSS